MPTRNISLTDKLDAFVEQSVSSGTYQNASEVVREALRVLQQRQLRYETMIDRLRAEIRKGEKDIAAGRYTVLSSDDDIARLLDDIEARAAVAANTED